MDKQAIAKRIRARRKALGWSQMRLAQEVGGHMMTVSQWERAICPPAGKLPALAKALNVSTDFILFGKAS